tara:strand:- start:1310 stop:1771 length:462 start_codon:yes stop_codon:yes gene_type:complete
MLVDPGIAIGLGIILSLFFTETLGVTAGGLIVPGYIAIYLNEPYMVIGTFSISIFTYFVVRFLSYFMLIYGKRRLVLSLLIGFLTGYTVRNYVDSSSFLAIDGELLVIGNIIPGLIASWMDRQGVLRTMSVIFITASIVQLILMLLYRGAFYV